MVDNFGNAYSYREVRLGNSQGSGVNFVPVVSGAPVNMRLTFENVAPEAVSIAKLTILGGWNISIGEMNRHRINIEFRGCAA